MCPFRPKTGFQLWLEENRKSIVADRPDLDETEVIREAMGGFRALTAEERLVGTLGGTSDRHYKSLSVSAA